MAREDTRALKQYEHQHMIAADDRSRELHVARLNTILHAGGSLLGIKFLRMCVEADPPPLCYLANCSHSAQFCLKHIPHKTGLHSQKVVLQSWTFGLQFRISVGWTIFPSNSKLKSGESLKNSLSLLRF